jgi:hypothetical protein
VREIAQRLVLDGAALAITSSQQMRAIDLPFVFAGRGDDVGCSGACWNKAKYRRKSSKVKYFSDYKFN